jgi:prephenate dehydrogenase
MVLFPKVTVIGVGLIGGSLAKVMKEKGLATELTGAGSGRKSLELALRLGVIDRLCDRPADAVKDADCIVLASPVGAFEAVAREVGPHMKRGAILTDVGSVKGGPVRLLEALLPDGVHYVPGHPIAGKEKHGVSEASAALFAGAQCILTPTEKTDSKALEAVKALWIEAGARVVVMSADAHDHIFAAVSHLPHAAAFAMVNTVAEFHAGADNYMAFSGAGFRDFSRIAASSPEMWRDICLLNGPNLIVMIERFQASLDKIKTAIGRKDADGLERLFRTSSELRRGLK